MKEFLAGVVVTMLVIAAFPQVGRWITTAPYRVAGVWTQSDMTATPAYWQGGGRGGRMGGGARGAAPGYVD